MSDIPASIFDSPHRAEEMRRAQEEWDARHRRTREILREQAQRKKPPGRKPRGKI